jgi:hypothetical protein
MSRILVANAYGNAEVIPVVVYEHNGLRYGIDLSSSSMYIFSNGARHVVHSELSSCQFCAFLGCLPFDAA